MPKKTKKKGTRKTKKSLKRAKRVVKNLAAPVPPPEQKPEPQVSAFIVLKCGMSFEHMFKDLLSYQQFFFAVRESSEGLHVLQEDKIFLRPSEVAYYVFKGPVVTPIPR